MILFVEILLPIHMFGIKYIVPCMYRAVFRIFLNDILMEIWNRLVYYKSEQNTFSEINDFMAKKIMESDALRDIL